MTMFLYKGFWSHLHDADFNQSSLALQLANSSPDLALLPCPGASALGLQCSLSGTSNASPCLLRNRLAGGGKGEE